MELKTFVVKRIKNHPFDVSDCMKDKLFLLNKETSEVEGEFEQHPLFKEGDEITSEQLKSFWQNKKNKHLEPGDKVLFNDNSCEGTIVNIKDADDYDNVEFNLKDCFNIYKKNGLNFEKYSKEPESNLSLKFKDVNHKPYIVFSVEMEKEQRWQRLEQLYREKFSDAKVSETFDWLKKHVNPK